MYIDRPTSALRTNVVVALWVGGAGHMQIRPLGIRHGVVVMAKMAARSSPTAPRSTRPHGGGGSFGLPTGEAPLTARERKDAIALIESGKAGIRDELRVLGRRLNVKEVKKGAGDLARFRAALLRALEAGAALDTAPARAPARERRPAPSAARRTAPTAPARERRSAAKGPTSATADDSGEDEKEAEEEEEEEEEEAVSVFRAKRIRRGGSAGAVGGRRATFTGSRGPLLPEERVDALALLADRRATAPEIRSLGRRLGVKVGERDEAAYRAAVLRAVKATASLPLLKLPTALLANVLRYLGERDVARTDAATRPPAERVAGVAVGAAVRRALDLLAGGCRRTMRCGAHCADAVVDPARYAALDPGCRGACWGVLGPKVARGLTLWNDPRQAHLDTPYNPNLSISWRYAADSPSYRPAFAAKPTKAVVPEASRNRTYAPPSPADPEFKRVGLAAVKKPAAPFAKLRYVGGVGCDRESFYVDLGILKVTRAQLLHQLTQLIPTNDRALTAEYQKVAREDVSVEERDDYVPPLDKKAYRLARWNYQLTAALEDMREYPYELYDLTLNYGREVVVPAVIDEVVNPSLRNLALDILRAVGHARVDIYVYSTNAAADKGEDLQLEYWEDEESDVWAVMRVAYLRPPDRDHTVGGDHTLVPNGPLVADVRGLQRLLPILQPWLPGGLVEHWLQLGARPFRVADKAASYRLRNVPMAGCAPKTRAAIARAAEEAAKDYARFGADQAAVVKDNPRLAPLLRAEDDEDDEE